MVLDGVEDLVAARAEQKAASLPACALEGDRTIRRFAEHHVAEVEASCRAVTDLSQRAVGEIAPPGGDWLLNISTKLLSNNQCYVQALHM